MGKMIFRLLLMLLLLGGIQWELYGKSQDLYCSVCKKKLKKRFLRSDNNKLFCDKACFETTRPSCAQCGKRIEGRFFRSGNKSFCSEKCIEESNLISCMRCKKSVKQGMFIESAYGKFFMCMTCSKVRGCVVCHRPTGKMRRMPNKCTICRDCDKDIIDDLRDMQSVLEKVRSVLQRNMRFTYDHPIYLEMRSFGRNPDEPFDGKQEMGLYIYEGKMQITQPPPGDFWHDKKTEVKYVDEKCVIVIMDSLPRFKAEEIMAHELAHDFMNHRWRYIKDLKVREGFAELVAAEYNRLTGRSKWNYRMEKNTDPVYGDGYRLVKSWYKKGSWREVFRQFDKANQAGMPEELKQH